MVLLLSLPLRGGISASTTLSMGKPPIVIYLSNRNRRRDISDEKIKSTLKLFLLFNAYSWLPPGPPRRFLIGNLLDFPQNREWLTFNQWAKEYGDLVYLDIFGTSMLFVNSYDIAKEMFDKKGNIYSNRPISTVMTDLLKLDWTLLLLRYSEKWRRTRTYFHQYFNPAIAENYKDIHMKYVKVLLQRLYHSPENYRAHIRFSSGAAILEITYGMQPKSETDPFVILSEETIAEITRAGLPGTYLVDIFPILKYVPSWFPGAGFKTELARLAAKADEMATAPVNMVKAALRNGTAIPSITSSLIEQFDANPAAHPDFEEYLKIVSASCYIAGIDSTDGILLQFLFTMLLHPEIQKRAHDELDKVVGPDYLPSLDDKKNLPYIQAIYNEMLRWNTIAPTALPHSLDADDVIGEYFIPKGTIVFGNSWSLLRSKSVYGDDADEFKPERFLDPNMPFPEPAFGFGRRHLGENSVFIFIACILHIYRILPFEDENGKEELPKAEDYDSGLVFNQIYVGVRNLSNVELFRGLLRL
ncbi:hypothetical protein Clacol_010000 [Clathrus columnatus]|uniref:Cytochrome P450 n=1 Tax=Clathrus columnatus TaxID=1419009 RepID=A0AAV5AM24_9AGAM|nr:hypothetical protein Clacol_010000 [Clathrus columnatus]